MACDDHSNVTGASIRRLKVFHPPSLVYHNAHNGRIFSSWRSSFSSWLSTAIIYRLHQFDAVAKGIIDVGVAEAIERFIPNDRSARLFASADEFIQPLDE